MKIKNKIRLFKFFFILFIVSGCTPINKITYINNSMLGEWDISPIPPKHHLEIGDNLIVRVIVRDDEFSFR